jgi:hypothetical protein
LIDVVAPPRIADLVRMPAREILDRIREVFGGRHLGAAGRSAGPAPASYEGKLTVLAGSAFSGFLRRASRSA